MKIGLFLRLHGKYYKKIGREVNKGGGLRQAPHQKFGDMGIRGHDRNLLISDRLS